MKKKQFNSKLSLNKTTIANLSKEELHRQHGGAATDDCSVILCKQTDHCPQPTDDCGPTDTCTCVGDTRDNCLSMQYPTCIEVCSG